MGRSRGGLTTKIHALVDACGLPIALKLTAGQAHDGRSAADRLGSIHAGVILLADRVDDADALWQGLAARGAWANVKPMPSGENARTARRAALRAARRGNVVAGRLVVFVVIAVASLARRLRLSDERSRGRSKGP
jgi:transposase